MTDAQKKDFTLRISQANQAGLTIILYEITEQFLEEAKAAYGKNDTEGFRLNVHKAQDCIRTCQQSLQMNYELAPVLRRLYVFLHAHLSRALVECSDKPIEETLHLIGKLHDAYSRIEGQDEEGPIMENVQKVYAGLTYGRNSLTENLADTGTERGYRI